MSIARVWQIMCADLANVLDMRTHIRHPDMTMHGMSHLLQQRVMRDLRVLGACLSMPDTARLHILEVQGPTHY